MTNDTRDSESKRQRRTGNWHWANRENIDERLERAIRFLEVGGVIHTTFNQDTDLTFLHDGNHVRSHRNRERNPGWFSEGDKAESDLRHQLRLDRDYDWGLAEDYRR